MNAVLEQSVTVEEFYEKAQEGFRGELVRGGELRGKYADRYFTRNHCGKNCDNFRNVRTAK